MGKDLRMEIFDSKDVVKPVSLHVYQLHSQKIDNSFSVIRGAVWKLKNYNHDPPFSIRIEPYVKRDMRTRLILDEDFINDIGVLEEINDLQFNSEPCDVKNIGYSRGKVPLPKLICGKNRILEVGKEFQVFNCGFYRKTEKTIKIGYIYPKNTYDKMKAVVNAIYSFAMQGKVLNNVNHMILIILAVDSDSLIELAAELELGFYMM